MSDDDTPWLPGVHAAPNIVDNPDIYEIENRAADPDGLIEQAIREIAPWEDQVVLDLGAGTGFHVPRFHREARHVIAAEPDDALRLRAMERISELGLEKTSVMAGSAEKILLPAGSVDLVHARFAYFWGPGCEPGLEELKRVLRPGGAAFIIDNDWTQGTFASWLKRSSYCENIDPEAVRAFWEEQGFERLEVMSRWEFDAREDLEAVIQIEFPPDLVASILEEHDGLVVDYGYAIYYRFF